MSLREAVSQTEPLLSRRPASLAQHSGQAVRLFISRHLMSAPEQGGGSLGHVCRIPVELLARKPKAP